jgi:SAM-dependent methyltransferase
MKKLITDNILKDLNKDTAILEIYCGYGPAYKILKSLGYNNYIGIDDNIHKIARCKSLFNNIEERNKFKYYENINEFVSNNKFDVIFFIGYERLDRSNSLSSYKTMAMSTLIRSTKAKIFYCVQSNSTTKVNKEKYISKIRDISKKLNCFPDFSWKISDNSNKCQITGINHTSLSLLNNSYLIMRDLVTEIINNMENNCRVLLDIMALIVDKYTCYNNKPIETDVLTIETESENNMIYVENYDELHVIIPLINNFRVDLDNDSFNALILDKGDIILINKMNYIASSECLQFIYK